MITVVPAGIATPPKSSSSTATRVTTGTTLYSRSVSFKQHRVYSRLFTASRFGSVPGSAFPKTPAHSVLTFSILPVDIDSSCSVQVNIAALVSCPARRNVLISKHSCFSVSLPYSFSVTFSSTRSKMSSGTAASLLLSHLVRHRCRTMAMIAPSSCLTRFLCRHHSGDASAQARHGDKLRVLHSSMIGRYSAGNRVSLSAG
mmetsp:Transcript_11663/g.43210  ORF Transcript_11663/g.43210 Transcript_11663/m.43210 type:complete len:201 (-) Transcript_11663:665-1267(-)